MSRDYAGGRGRDYTGGRGQSGGRGDRRDSYRERDGYNTDRSTDSRRSDYSSSSRGGGFGGRGRGGGGGFGTGKQAADDSQTKPVVTLPEVSLTEAERVSVQPKNPDKGQINSYGFQSGNLKNTYQYDIEYMGETKRGKVIELTSFRRKERQEVHSGVRMLFAYLTSTNADFFDAEPTSKHCIVYDCAKMLFSQKKMLEKGEKKEIVIEYDNVPDGVKDVFGPMTKVTVTVRLTNELKFSQISACPQDLEVNRPFTQYLELLFSQGQLNSTEYAAFGNKYFNKKKTVSIDRSAYIMKPGVERSVKLVDGSSGTICMLPKLKVFYPAGDLMQVVKQLCDRDDIWRVSDSISSSLKNVAVRSKHLKKNRDFRFHSLSERSAADTFFKIEDKEVSVAEYFDTKYRVRLSYANYPCVVEKKGKDQSFWPIEVLEILPDQPVPKAKMGNELNSKIIRQCQRLPAVFVEEVENERADAKIQNADPLMKSSGVRINVGRLNVVDTVQIEPPAIQYKNTQKELKSGVWGMLRDDKFINGAHIKKLKLILADRRLDSRRAQEFCENLIDRAKTYGMTIDASSYETWNNPSSDCRKLRDYAEDGVDFAFIIGDMDELHHGMKYAELETKLVTQNVTTRTVGKANNSLYDNLVMKMNLKAGGTNFELSTGPSLAAQVHNINIVKTLLKNSLFFGVDVSHPGPQSSFQRATNEELVDVTAVGFASNGKMGSVNMTRGSFGYQKMRETTIDPVLLAAEFDDRLTNYYRDNGEHPLWVVVYRAGVSEGEITKVKNSEVSVYREVLEEYKKKNPDAKTCRLTIMMVNRKTIHRVVPKVIDARNKAPQQNCPSGTCISEGFGGMPKQSFMLISQRALIGTANPPMYTILYDDSKFHMECLKLISYSLCFAHGIVTSPTALPSPLVSAADLSKRARNNFKTGRADVERFLGAGGDAVYRQNAGDLLTEDEKKEIEDRERESFGRINETLRVQIENVRFWA